MRKEIRVSIPEPCHEDWNTMTSQDKGRHCKVCEKTVVDFTDKTDEYIVKTFEKEDKLCGRFKGQQLDRPLAYSRKDRTNYLTAASAAVLAYLSFGSNKSYAQGKIIADITAVSHSKHIKGKIAHSVLKNKVVSGRIIGINNKPLGSVQVSEKGTNNLTVTDENGNYTLKVSSTSIMIFVHPEYQDYEVLVEDSNYISIEMVETNRKTESNNVIIISGIITDENGIPLPIANIVEKETTNGISSDFDGNYTLEVQPNAIIEVSYVGYQTKEVSVQNTNEVESIILELDNTSCNSYIIAGYVEANYVSDCKKNKRKIERKEERAERKRKRQEKRKDKS